ncbi:hypothetical protein [Flavobacterium davisii]|uniref:hypothetical protein n=1 Tax=Flavobacterium davisii TaxID=2906077 RepID=UPI0035CF5CC6
MIRFKIIIALKMIRFAKVDTTANKEANIDDELIEKASNTSIYKAFDGKNYSIYHTEKEGKRVAIITLDEKRTRYFTPKRSLGQRSYL